MAAIPRDLLQTEVAFDAGTGLAHRRAATSKTPAEMRTASHVPDLAAPNCDPKGTPLRPLSAFSADRQGANACADPMCFGAALDAPRPVFRTLRAAKPKPRKTTARR